MSFWVYRVSPSPSFFFKLFFIWLRKKIHLKCSFCLLNFISYLNYILHFAFSTHDLKIVTKAKPQRLKNISCGCSFFVVINNLTRYVYTYVFSIFKLVSTFVTAIYRKQLASLFLYLSLDNISNLPCILFISSILIHVISYITRHTLWNWTWDDPLRKKLVVPISSIFFLTRLKRVKATNLQYNEEDQHLLLFLQSFLHFKNIMCRQTLHFTCKFSFEIQIGHFWQQFYIFADKRVAIESYCQYIKKSYKRAQFYFSNVISEVAIIFYVAM